MLPEIDLATVRFAAPEYLWLLALPGLLLLVWIWRVVIWREDVRHIVRRRQTPTRQRFTPLGGLFAWFCVLAAMALTVTAVAQPVAAVSLMRTAGVDLVVLQDGSSSMHVRDVEPDRWRRSMRFVRVLAESLQWDNKDRMAIAVFAHIAAPQVRLTTDANTIFFFLDHLSEKSPFPLEDDTTWNTNIELGVFWGVRLVEKDEEVNGRSPNGKVFVLISDGQAWSGEVATALALAQARRIPIFVVGVGTPTGGFIPEASVVGGKPVPARTMSNVRSRLDRESLTTIATAGSGEYFELDRHGDRQIATAIIEAGRTRAGTTGSEERVQELYGICLMAAAALMCLATVFLREPFELWLQVGGVGATLAAVWLLTL